MALFRVVFHNLADDVWAVEPLFRTLFVAWVELPNATIPCVVFERLSNSMEQLVLFKIWHLTKSAAKIAISPRIISQRVFFRDGNDNRVRVIRGNFNRNCMVVGLA